MSRVLAVHLTLELPLCIRCEPWTLAPHMQCSLEVSQGTRQGHFLEGDGALGHGEPRFLWALASVVFPTGNLVCPVVCLHHTSATACFKKSPASSPTVSYSSCCPVFISQVLPASQDLPWAVNSTIKQELLPLALSALVLQFTGPGLCFSSRGWRHSLMVEVLVTAVSPTPAHRTPDGVCLKCLKVPF